MACSSESRAFFVLDSLSAGSSLWTKKALLRLGSTLAVTLKQPCPLGVAVLSRGSKPGQAGQLQILLRLGPAFQAREYLSCIKRLPTPAADAAASDGTMLGSALLALMQHMQKLPARPDCHNHLFILSSSFASCASNPKMQKVLQLVSLQASYSFHFLQVTGPEAELHTAGAAGNTTTDPSSSSSDHHQQQQQQQQAAGVASNRGSDVSAAAAGGAEFHSMLSSMGLCDSITYDAVVADGEAATDLMCQSWLRDLLTPARGSSSSRPGPCTPDLLLRFGTQTLPCELQQYILQLDPWLLPAQLCPCHHLPMHPSSSSSVAAAHAAAASASSDAGSMAALLVLPEASPWSCCITGQPVMQPVSSCPSDARILQLGRHTQLTLPPTAPAALGPGPQGAASILPGGGGCGSTNSHASRLRMLQALPLSHGQPCELSVQHMVHPSAVDSMLLYGMPLLLTPTALTAAPAQQAGIAGSDQNVGAVHNRHNQQQHNNNSEVQEAAMLMRALCQLLLEEQQVLLAVSSHDLLRRIQTPLQQWYMLQPSADGSSLLLRWVASREQLLPPKQRDGSSGGLCSTVGASAAAAAECVEEQVVLLDAEQLDAVRASLAGLKGLRGTAAGGCCAGTQQGPAPAVSSQFNAAVGAECGGAAPADAAGTLGSDQQVVDHEPLLLSCGLDAWVTQVLEASAATYTPPPAPAAAAPLQVAAVPAQVSAPPPAAAAGQGHGQPGMQAWRGPSNTATAVRAAAGMVPGGPQQPGHPQQGGMHQGQHFIQQQQQPPAQQAGVLTMAPADGNGGGAGGGVGGGCAGAPKGGTANGSTGRRGRRNSSSAAAVGGGAGVGGAAAGAPPPTGATAVSARKLSLRKV